MKKNIFFVAIAALTLSLTACQKDDDITVAGSEVDSKARVKSTSDLNNTDWTAAITFVLPLYVDGDTNAVNIPVVYNRAE